MTHDATPDAARLRGWGPRPPADDAARQAEDTAARVSALLDELDRARLGLSADLGLLASAVEMQAYDVADQVVDGTRSDLAALRDRLAGGPATPSDLPSDALPAVPPRRSRRKVLRAALPAAPALAAAAALVGVLAGLTPTPRPSAPSGPVRIDAAAASYAELYRLHERGVGGAQLRDAARELHAEVARVMALAATDPTAAEAALRELLGAVTAVADDDQRADLRSVLAESQRLLGALEAAVTATTGAPQQHLPRPLPQNQPRPEGRPQPDEALRPPSRPAPQPAAPAAGGPSSAAPANEPSSGQGSGSAPTATPTASPGPSSPPVVPTTGSTGAVPGTLSAPEVGS